MRNDQCDQAAGAGFRFGFRPDSGPGADSDPGPGGHHHLGIKTGFPHGICDLARTSRSLLPACALRPAARLGYGRHTQGTRGRAHPPRYRDTGYRWCGQGKHTPTGPRPHTQWRCYVLAVSHTTHTPHSQPGVLATKVGSLGSNRLTCTGGKAVQMWAPNLLNSVACTLQSLGVVNSAKVRARFCAQRRRKTSFPAPPPGLRSVGGPKLLKWGLFGRGSNLLKLRVCGAKVRPTPYV